MIKKLPGILLCAVIGTAAWFSAKLLPIGGVTISILIGIVTGNLIKLPEYFSSGTAFCEKKVLTWAIAIMGISLDYTILADLGLPTFILIIAAVVFTISTALILGKKTGLNKELCLLIGIGNAVCGSSAIAATQGVIDTDEKTVGLSIAAINFLGTIGIFLLPTLGMIIFRFNELQTGVLTGNTLQAIGQVSAAGFSISDKAGETAVIVKMCRILMITPLVIILSIKKGNGIGIKRIPVIPRYIIVFIIMSIIGSFGIIPELLIPHIKNAGKMFLITAMAGIGMKISLKDLAVGGRQALLLGSAVWICQILFSGVLIILMV